jgi:plasmid maintenance system killer protein
MRTIPLTRGEEAIVDDEFYDMLSSIKWYFNGYYACNRSFPMGLKKKNTLWMHRIITECPDDKEVDHINGNKLDNRLANLRVVTHQENAMNLTRAKGYYWNKKDRKWQCSIFVRGKTTYIGNFDDENEARKAYLDAKAIYHSAQ